MKAADGERARVFFALWPSAALRAVLGAHALEAQTECGGRAIVADNIHLTLFFVGAFERPQLRALERAAETVRGEAFSLVLDTLGYWRHNRIVWVGAAHCPRQLEALAAELRTALAAEGVAGEERPYSPHVTLVRNAERRPASRRIAPFTWEAREFVLIESVPADGGVRYQPLTGWRLQM